jgi:polysaccharide biosynthesis protein PslG
MKSNLALWFSLLPLASPAAGLPDLALPQGVGVNIHFTRGHVPDLDLIAAAGFKVVRMDFSWAGTERQEGQYDFAEYDALTADLERRGLRPYYILDYSNPVFEEPITSRDPVHGQERRDIASPQHRGSVMAFARWAAAAAEHFKGRNVIWEIWNEPNIGFWKPKPDVAQYVALAQATCRAIRIVDPQAIIVAPATSEFPWPFLEDCFKAGLLDQIDAVSVHPYRDYRQGPETAAADYQRLRGLIARYASTDARKQLPILSGEWGYASHARGVSLETQGSFIARQQLANLLAGIPVSIWYDWKNDGANPAEREENFGTVTADLKPKPAYLAVQILTRELEGYHIEKRVEAGSPDDYVLLLANARSERKLAAWTTGAPHAITLQTTSTTPAEVQVISGQGQAATVAVRSGRLELEVRESPSYVTLGSSRLVE